MSDEPQGRGGEVSSSRRRPLPVARPLLPPDPDVLPGPPAPNTDARAGRAAPRHAALLTRHSLRPSRRPENGTATPDNEPTNGTGRRNGTANGHANGSDRTADTADTAAFALPPPDAAFSRSWLRPAEPAAAPLTIGPAPEPTAISGATAAAVAPVARKPAPPPAPPAQRPRPRPGPAAPQPPQREYDETQVVLRTIAPTPAAPVQAPTPPKPPATPPSETSSDDGGEKGEKPKRSHPKARAGIRRTVRYAVFIGVVVLAAALLRIFVVQPFFIPSESMEPTLHGCSGCKDDHILVDKLSYRAHSVRESDIVVFDRPTDLATNESVLVKRVIGLPGDKLALRDGAVYVNGLRLDEPYINKACGARATRPETGRSSWTIPAGDVFVLGDNRCDSTDSRTFGPIPESSIIGRAFFIVWPWHRIGGV